MNQIFDPRLPGLLAQMHWRVPAARLVMVGLELRERVLALQLLQGVTGRFVQCFVEPDMVTLVLDETEWRRITPAFPRARVNAGLRAICLEVDLPADLVGFLALLTHALAQAGVPLLAMCGYCRDHLVVREADLDTATRVIERLIDEARAHIAAHPPTP